MERDQVILVDEKDHEVGLAGKMEAHQQGTLHRAFSVFIFNEKGEMLLQRRAMNKYHSGGLWTNACCSHPQPGELTIASARKRLNEELGFETSLEKIFDFTYQADFDNGLTEHEFDHVFIGYHSGPVNFNKDEVMDFCYKDMPGIIHSLQLSPSKYTAWFQLAFPKIENWWKENHERK